MIKATFKDPNNGKKLIAKFKHSDVGKALTAINYLCNIKKMVVAKVDW